MFRMETPDMGSWPVDQIATLDRALLSLPSILPVRYRAGAKGTDHSERLL